MSEPVGIIYPPPELRGIVDSTAKYVAKNGGAFEERIKREHRDKPKFSFLLSDDPFNAYYQFKVKEIRNQLLGNLDTKQSEDTSEQSKDSEQTNENNNIQHDNYQSDQEDSQNHKSQNDQQNYKTNNSLSNVDESSNQQHDQSNDESRNDISIDTTNDNAPRFRLKLDEYIQEMTMKLEEPPPLNYLATSAPHLTYMDSDIIKLTSQFIATYGRSFLLELVSREQNNSLFDFLKPQHGQFSYMTNLIMQYALIRNQPLDILEQLEKDATSQKHVLDRIRMRSEWNKMIELEQRKKEEAEEKEKALYSQIDWHDFVIVETIDYQPDEKGEYPPTTADQVGTRLLLQQRYEEQNVPEEMEIDMDVESDQEDDNREEDDTQEESEFNFIPPSADQVVIRRDYDPKMMNKVAQADNYFVSPITNERIAVNKMDEHVRYNLSDPKHLEKKGQMLQERMNEEAVFASGSQIQSNLKGLAERRTDIFGINDEEAAIGRRIGEEEKEAPKDDRLIWDGHKSSLKKKKLG